MQNFSTRLAEAIVRSGKSKGALAAEIGVALSTVSRWLGGTTPKAEALNQIAKFLGVDAKWLLNGEPSEIDLAARRIFSELASEDMMELFRRIYRGAGAKSRKAHYSKALAAESEEDYIARTEIFREYVNLVFLKSEQLCEAILEIESPSIIPIKIKELATELEESIGFYGSSVDRIVDEAQVLRKFSESSPAVLHILREKEKGE